MWLSAIKLAVSAGSKIYANKQRTKMAMSDAQLMHATKMAQGQEAYQGKLLEARQSDWKDEAVLIILSLPVLVLAWAVVSDDPSAMDNEQKRMQADARLSLDKSRAMMNQDYKKKSLIKTKNWLN